MDLGNKWEDEEIWNYARENNLTIISKDSDF
jgi:predicted nuclease of predicted toxin-antitoxin system